MKPIRTIAVVGAGAMGAAYAAMFTDAGGLDVFFVAGGERRRRLSSGPISVNGRAYAIPVIDPATSPDPADLILVALKHHHLAEAVNDIKAFAGSHTVILSVMNGLVSEQIIGAACGMDKMVHAIAVGIDAVHENGRFTYANAGKIIFGDIASGADSARVARLQEVLNRAGIANEVPADILRALWWKFMINVGINQASAVLGATYGVFHRFCEARDLMVALMEEVIALAPKAGIDLGRNDIEAWCRILAGLAPAGKTSMLQDIEAGRKTEVEVFSGKVVELGRQYGVPTPVNATVCKIIKVLEQTP